jgi:ATP phosphoribosyltransferase
MLQFAIPNKGALSEGAVQILKAAGYKCSRYSRELIVSDRENGIDFVFLRPRDIATYVGRGIIDLGITGRDLTADSKQEVSELLPLNFSRSRFCYAVPKDSDLTPDKFNGLRIATSYPEIVRQDMAKRGFETQIVRLDGAVEISVQLGVADAIADVVESGRTLIEAGLKTVGDVVMESEAIVIGANDEIGNMPEVKKILARLRGVLVARDYVLIEYNVPRNMLEACCQITPGIESPTISPLSNPDWVAVKAMIKSGKVNVIMDELQEKGAQGIFVTALNSCRI